jgi:NADH-quinone oxidoreductase subunit C
MDASPVLELLRQSVPGADLQAVPAIDMPTVRVGADHILEVCRTLRDHPDLQFALLVDVTAVDRLPAEPRFDVVYLFACIGDAYARGTAAPPRRLRLKVPLAGDSPRIRSIVSVYPAAGWPEREVFDLFGIAFEDHPDLRRILMPEDWDGFPLRKDYAVQIRKTPQGWSPIQLSAEEFAANIRAERARAAVDAARHSEDASGE